MFMCGSYGDPAAGQHTIEIYNYFRTVNPTIVLGMNSNGAIQNTHWWSHLGQLFNQSRDYCVFSIDGLEDTNHIYRKNVHWGNLIKNVQAFIKSGGSAHWDMLVYQHNEHQVSDCKQLAHDLGFKWFRAKVSKRGFINGLERPIHWQMSTTHRGAIQCHAQDEQSVYIDAQGRVSPCCWLGSRQKDFIGDDLDTVSLSWDTKNPNLVCVESCSTNRSGTIFKNQWQQNVELL
jgi:MoaA/NifB/PqqE/SkfB family radical SAM enzyme